jgi:nitrogen fixation protein NifX
MSAACVADLLPADAHLIVAFASDDGEMLDEHFGSAKAFYV